MNCANFATIITELARDQIVEAHLREAALEHPQYCAVCANRFANEMALTAGLRAFAAETAAISPSNKVELALLDAFRTQVTVESSTKEAPSIVKPAVVWSRFAMAAAAIIVIALTSIVVIAIRAQRNNLSGQKKDGRIENPKPAPSNVNSTVDSGSHSQSVKEDDHKNILAGADHDVKPKTVQHRFNHKVNRDAALVNNPDPTAGFISLTQAADFMPLESGQIVKVEMPRAALLAIGLPVNAQRAGESIKAELLVGQDGIARAIRFLQ